MSGADPLTNQPIAVSVITGFLGSGKTTLLNQLLAHPDMDQTAVLINEFGEVGLDHLMVGRLDEDVVLLKSGCICCTVQGQLVDGLKELYVKRLAGDLPPFSRVVIETTGLADPLPIVTCIMRDPLFKHVFRLDSLITTVDAVYGYCQLDEHVEATRQAAVADRILLTKTDLAEPGDVLRLRKRLHELNPGARVLRSEFGRVHPAELFGAQFFDPSEKSVDVQRWLNEEAYASGTREARHEHGGEQHRDVHANVNRHDEHISSFCVTLECPLPWQAFKDWYEALAEKKGDHLLRVKGIVNIAGEAVPYVIHCVQSTQHEPQRLASWPDSDHRSRIVFITRDLSVAEVEADLREHLERADGDAVAAPTRAGKESSTGSFGATGWLNDAQLARIFAALSREEDRVAADALKLMLLTGASVDDAREGRWDELDLERRTWTKGRAADRPGPVKPRAREIKLSDAAVSLLKSLQARGESGRFVFSERGSALSADRLQLAWAAATRSANVESSSLNSLPPTLARGVFGGLSRDLAAKLLGLEASKNNEVV